MVSSQVWEYRGAIGGIFFLVAHEVFVESIASCQFSAQQLRSTRVFLLSMFLLLMRSYGVCRSGHIGRQSA